MIGVKHSLSITTSVTFAWLLLFYRVKNSLFAQSSSLQFSIVVGMFCGGVLVTAKYADIPGSNWLRYP
jgi:hypothetical protein